MSMPAKVLLPIRGQGVGPGDGELVVRVLGGDRWAEEALYRRHAPRLLAVLIRLVGNRQDGLDLLQDTFVHTFARLEGLKDPGAYRGWLLRCGVRAALKALRRRRLLTRLGLADGADESLAFVASPDASQEVAAQLRQVGALLAELPTQERVAWMLRYVEGYELTEVAAACGASLATIKRRIARAQATISEQIQIEEPKS